MRRFQVGVERRVHHAERRCHAALRSRVGKIFDARVEEDGAGHMTFGGDPTRGGPLFVWFALDFEKCVLDFEECSVLRKGFSRRSFLGFARLHPLLVFLLDRVLAGEFKVTRPLKCKGVANACPIG